jgi:hypothetical protein
VTAALPELYARGDACAGAHLDLVERTQLRLGRCRASLARRECSYQKNLARLRRGRRKLARLQDEALTCRMANNW